MKKLYSIRDIKAANYSAPFVQHTNEEAIRAVAASISADPKSMLSRFSSDYELHFVGTWNENTGVIYPPEDSVSFVIGLSSIQALLENKEAAHG